MDILIHKVPDKNKNYFVEIFNAKSQEKQMLSHIISTYYCTQYVAPAATEYGRVNIIFAPVTHVHWTVSFPLLAQLPLDLRCVSAQMNIAPPWPYSRLPLLMENTSCVGN
ncbi:Hypothetical protein CINCED_3A012724 [Cinara cedri]|uniref:Uncharacterized protein n=1 Tax=Cinara cedri TaxID=506608 RepID=A0A5E4NE53_9HEMI|nr:Hypothetical protein CINCED_3A012724 [Cinara cedri]